jgi:hypothetical protein
MSATSSDKSGGNINAKVYPPQREEPVYSTIVEKGTIQLGLQKRESADIVGSAPASGADC